ncbi:hypothetical protein O6H91_17G027500 [Diphasiastrum complanatum]|nr:hypothetical protein O6H91_17G027500 [Diphasiastrum complanatum]KAJ7524909.1 hypothetical protein O6H91_17G027500 [Diphasiastrum complanatum]KAJ7524910.1 hypothetical protein O6H91_17G027500 [Diphasiastrum complanatum]KAJ7524911.1 hypothetical protein O6H91_17G027500 [Diphasiastrum complanatum]KAJ7524913.1 hypothetical protein O6H91_17G027500 [Diphasiastrum complanatum]
MAQLVDVRSPTSVSDVPIQAECRSTKLSAPVGICQGYQMITGSGCFTALKGETESSGGTSTVICKVCTSIEELSESLEVDQSLSVSFLGAASVDEKLKLIEQQKITTNSISIVVYAKHNMGTETVTDVGLKPGIQIPASTKEVKDFVNSYGDCFLSSKTRGGEYFAMYTFYSETREEQRDLSVEMKAQGLFSPVSIDASFQVKLNNFLKSQKVHSSFRQIMSGIANPEFPTQDKLIEFALKFPSLELTAPVITSFKTSGYERVPGMSTCFYQVGKNRELLTGRQKKPNFIADLCRLQQLKNDISTVKEAYGFYGTGFFDEDTKLKTRETEVEADVVKAERLLEEYVDDPTKPITDTPVLTSLIQGLTPSLDYVVKRSQEYGSPASPARPTTAFNDVNDAGTFFSQRTKIKTIEILDMGNDLLGVVRITYSSKKDTWTVSHGRTAWSSFSSVAKMVLSAGEFVTNVRTCYVSSGPLMIGVSFKTSDNRQISTDAGFPFNGQWNLPKGCFLMGFAGVCGNDYGVFRLQMIYGSFRPVTWDTLDRDIHSL